MEISIKGNVKVDSVFIYTKNTAIRFTDETRLEISTDVLESLVSLYTKAKNSSGEIGVAVA